MITVEMLRKILIFYFLYTVQPLFRFSHSYNFFKAGTLFCYKTTNKHFIILKGEPYFT